MSQFLLASELAVVAEPVRIFFVIYVKFLSDGVQSFLVFLNRIYLSFLFSICREIYFIKIIFL